MSVPTRDAAFELHGACVHSLRFSFYAPLDYPYAPAKVVEDNPPPALFRRVQAVSPPPARKGKPWHTGMTLDGKPFDPAGTRDRLDEVTFDQGVPGLDEPEPENVVLDWYFDVPRNQRTVAFPGDDKGAYRRWFRSWTPATTPGHPSTKNVTYNVTHHAGWVKRPSRDG